MIRHLVTAGCRVCTHLEPQTKRCISTAPVLSKRYKFSLNEKNLRSGDNFAGGYRKPSKDHGYIDGHRVSFFQFDSLPEKKRKQKEETEDRGPTRRHQQFGNCVWDTVDSILRSKKAPQELNDCQIEIVDVISNHNISSATIVWKLPEDIETAYSEGETEEIINRHLGQIRALYPCFSNRSSKPMIQFIHSDKL